MALFGDGGRRELEKKAKAEGRLPPGQSLTLKWPVLHYGSIPVFDAARWDFQISGEVEEPKRLTWNEFRALPQSETTSDFHCVTRWSRLDNRWKGVLFTDVMKLVKAKPAAKFASVLAEEGYAANIPLDDLLRPNVLFAFEHDGAPLTAEHGGADASDRAASLRVEEREMGARFCAAGPRPVRLLGAQRLPRLRRSVERAAVLRKLEIAGLSKDAAAISRLGVFRQLIRGSLGFGWVDLDAAFEMGAVLDADSRRGNIAGDRAVLSNVHAAACMDVPDHFAGDDHFACVNFGIELGGGADDQFMAAQRDRAIHLPVNLQIFIASNLPFDLNASAETRRAAGS